MIIESAINARTFFSKAITAALIFSIVGPFAALCSRQAYYLLCHDRRHLLGITKRLFLAGSSFVFNWPHCLHCGLRLGCPHATALPHPFHCLGSWCLLDYRSRTWWDDCTSYRLHGCLRCHGRSRTNLDRCRCLLLTLISLAERFKFSSSFFSWIEDNQVCPVSRWHIVCLERYDHCPGQVLQTWPNASISYHCYILFSPILLHLDWLELEIRWPVQESVKGYKYILWSLNNLVGWLVVVCESSSGLASGKGGGYLHYTKSAGNFLFNQS